MGGRAAYEIPASRPVDGVNLVVGGENNEDLLGSHCVGCRLGI